jgi:hypothetical protein
MDFEREKAILKWLLADAELEGRGVVVHHLLSLGK